MTKLHRLDLQIQAVIVQVLEMKTTMKMMKMKMKMKTKMGSAISGRLRLRDPQARAAAVQALMQGSHYQNKLRQIKQAQQGAQKAIYRIPIKPPTLIRKT